MKVRKREPTVLARIPLMLIGRAGTLGADEVRLRGRAATGGALGDPDARVPLSFMLAVWRRVVAALPQPTLGLRLGRRTRSRAAGLVGYAMAHSPTLDEALQRLSRYSRILNEASDYRIERTARHARIVLGADPTLDALRPPVDARLAGIIAVCREITGEAVAPIG